MFDGKFEWLNAGGMFGGFDWMSRHVRREFWKAKVYSMKVLVAWEPRFKIFKIGACDETSGALQMFQGVCGSKQLIRGCRDVSLERRELW